MYSLPFILAIVLKITSALLYFPLEISHLGDSGIILKETFKSIHSIIPFNSDEVTMLENVTRSVVHTLDRFHRHFISVNNVTNIAF